MPNVLHQWIVKLLFQLLNDHVSRHALGEVFFAPLPIELSITRYREPDLVFLRPERVPTVKCQPKGADLVMEVVSEGSENWQRDYVQKRAEYAAAGIDEYWIVDPQQRQIAVLTREHSAYREHGVFPAGTAAHSVLLPGFVVDTAAIFAKCNAAAD